MVPGIGLELIPTLSSSRDSVVTRRCPSLSSFPSVGHDSTMIPHRAEATPIKIA